MKNLLILPVLLLTLLGGNPAFSADFQKGLDAYKSGDYTTALREWKPLAEQGHADAQYNLGVMYDLGRGVPKNNETAFKWYTLAAEQGHVLAQHELGARYALGQGVRKDDVYAYMWWNIAASTGNWDSMVNRDIVATRVTPSHIAEARRFARECVEKNYKVC